MTERRHSEFPIDLEALMKGLQASPNADLVTRPTGRAVREAIEAAIADSAPHVAVSVIDFTGVRVLDFSCADEVVARLLLRYLPPERPGNVFFLFRGVEEIHGHAVAEVLARHGLAAVCDFGEGAFGLLGSTTREERTAWSTLERRKRISAGMSASLLGSRGDAMLHRLSERRLAYFDPAGSASSLSALARPVPPRDEP
ncbi:MAG: hypothetical protein OXU69_14540 [Gemmatimonadota bacterium]|nr:hypothetical protein [Gemmatimonadota bacterium]MDE2985919.1 hypothetical protein [Gemmatimonadota bacterium]